MDVPGGPAPLRVLGKEGEGEAEGGRERLFQSTHALALPVPFSLAFRYLIWEGGGHIFQGSG